MELATEEAMLVDWKPFANECDTCIGCGSLQEGKFQIMQRDKTSGGT